MSRSEPPPAGATTAGGQIVLGPKMEQFRRIYRWLNLTLVHQAIWPLLLVLTSAPAGKPQNLALPWFLARIAGPLTAALAALLYLRFRTATPARTELDRIGFAEPAPGPLARQARLLLIGLPLMVAVVRLLVGPAGPAAKLILFGLADVTAFQTVHYGVARRSYRDAGEGITVATILFAASWGLRDLLLTALGPSNASPVLAMTGGIAIGAVVALTSRALYRWPGGPLAAGALQWLLVYLVIGFA